MPLLIRFYVNGMTFPRTKTQVDTYKKTISNNVTNLYYLLCRCKHSRRGMYVPSRDYKGEYASGTFPKRTALTAYAKTKNIQE